MLTVIDYKCFALLETGRFTEFSFHSSTVSIPNSDMIEAWRTSISYVNITLLSTMYMYEYVTSYM